MTLRSTLRAATPFWTAPRRCFPTPPTTGARSSGRDCARQRRATSRSSGIHRCPIFSSTRVTARWVGLWHAAQPVRSLTSSATARPGWISLSPEDTRGREDSRLEVTILTRSFPHRSLLYLHGRCAHDPTNGVSHEREIDRRAVDRACG